MELMNSVKSMYPDMPEYILYVACLDYIIDPEKTGPDAETNPDIEKEILEMKAKADNIKGVIHGIEVVQDN
eukprot:765407-Hanusia_phi.AAC.1